MGRRRRRRQRGGIIPLILMAGKAIASSAASSAAKYGVKKALEKRRKKKIVRPPNMTFEEERAIRRALGIYKTESASDPVTSHHGRTRTETTTTTPLPTRGYFSHFRASSHCRRGGEWRGRVRGQERIGCGHAQETRGQNLSSAMEGQPAPAGQHVPSLAPGRQSHLVTL